MKKIIVTCFALGIAACDTSGTFGPPPPPTCGTPHTPPCPGTTTIKIPIKIPPEPPPT